MIRNIIRNAVLFLIGLFVLYLLTGALVNTSVVITSSELDEVLRAGLVALIFISATTLVAVVYHLENIARTHTQLLDKQVEQNRLLRALVKQGQGIQPPSSPKGGIRTLIDQDE